MTLTPHQKTADALVTSGKILGFYNLISCRCTDETSYISQSGSAWLNRDCAPPLLEFFRSVAMSETPVVLL